MSRYWKEREGTEVGEGLVYPHDPTGRTPGIAVRGPVEGVLIPGTFNQAIERAKPRVKAHLIDAMSSGYLPGKDEYFDAVTADILDAVLGGV